MAVKVVGKEGEPLAPLDGRQSLSSWTKFTPGADCCPHVDPEQAGVQPVRPAYFEHAHRLRAQHGQPQHSQDHAQIILDGSVASTRLARGRQVQKKALCGESLGVHGVLRRSCWRRTFHGRPPALKVRHASRSVSAVLPAAASSADLALSFIIPICFRAPRVPPTNSC